MANTKTTRRSFLAAAGALEDPSAEVRHAAARAMGSLGAAGVPALSDVVDRRTRHLVTPRALEQVGRGKRTGTGLE